MDCYNCVFFNGITTNIPDLLVAREPPFRNSIFIGTQNNTLYKCIQLRILRFTSVLQHATNISPIVVNSFKSWRGFYFRLKTIVLQGVRLMAEVIKICACELKPIIANWRHWPSVCMCGVPLRLSHEGCMWVWTRLGTAVVDLKILKELIKMQAFHANAIGTGVSLSTADPFCVLYLFKNQFKKVFLLLS